MRWIARQISLILVSNKENISKLGSVLASCVLVFWRALKQVWREWCGIVRMNFLCLVSSLLCASSANTFFFNSNRKYHGSLKLNTKNIFINHMKIWFSYFKSYGIQIAISIHNYKSLQTWVFGYNLWISHCHGCLCLCWLGPL